MTTDDYTLTSPHQTSHLLDQLLLDFFRYSHRGIEGLYNIFDPTYGTDIPVPNNNIETDQFNSIPIVCLTNDEPVWLIVKQVSSASTSRH